MAKAVTPRPHDKAQQQHPELEQQHDGEQQHAEAEPAAEPAGQHDEHELMQMKVKKKKKNKLLSQEKLRRLKEQHDKRGIVYISRWAAYTASTGSRHPTTSSHDMYITYFQLLQPRQAIAA